LKYAINLGFEHAIYDLYQIIAFKISQAEDTESIN